MPRTWSRIAVGRTLVHETARLFDEWLRLAQTLTLRATQVANAATSGDCKHSLCFSLDCDRRLL